MRSTSSLALLLLAVVAACSSADHSGPNAQRVALSFSTSARNSPSVIHATQSSPFTQMTGANTLVISKAQVVLKKIEITSNDAANCTADNSSGTASPSHMGGDSTRGSGHDSECEELRADPAIIDLPVDASVTSSVVATVPAGTYTSFEALIHAVRDSSPASKAFLAANPSFAGVAVHVEGTYNGTPFVYNGRTVAKLELAFNPPAVVGSTGLSITVNVDLGTWFVDASGNLIDPTTANDGGANAAMVSHNIHESFEAFEDENHDGKDDHAH
jgi:hypothetical protein